MEVFASRVDKFLLIGLHVYVPGIIVLLHRYTVIPTIKIHFPRFTITNAMNKFVEIAKKGNINHIIMILP